MVKIKNRPSKGLNKTNRITGRSKRNRKIKPNDPVMRVKFIQNHWDSNKSTKQNYEALGIRVDVDVAPKTALNSEAFSNLVQSSEHIPTETKIKEWELEILTKLQEVYGKDIKKMSKDIKLNPYQWTQKQIVRLLSFIP